MTGAAPDPALVAARRVLLDALEALGEQRGAVILVGAQAIYLHTGEGDIAVAPFTLDADLALEPAALKPAPDLTGLLQAAGFTLTKEIGIWAKSIEVAGRPGERTEVTVDFLVPERLGGAGRRAARLDVHGNRVARKARGLEAAVVERQTMRIGALDPSDARAFDVAVAGPGALLVAKIHKLADRGEDRASDKDALDVARLLRTIQAGILAASLAELRKHELAAEVTEAAIAQLGELFGDRRAVGARMAGRAVEALDSSETMAASCAVLTAEVLKELRRLIG